MAARDEDIAWYCELLAPAGRIGVRRMFGGTGLYADGLMFALEAFGGLYLKVDAETRGRFEAAGCRPFVYEGMAKPVEMSYWNAPDDAMDSPEAMRPWAMLALQAAQRGAAAKSAKKPKQKAAKTATKKIARQAAKKTATKTATKTAKSIRIAKTATPRIGTAGRTTSVKAKNAAATPKPARNESSARVATAAGKSRKR